MKHYKLCLIFLALILTSEFGVCQSQFNISVGASYFGNDLIRSLGLNFGISHNRHMLQLSGAMYYDTHKPNQIINTLDADLQGPNMLGVGYSYDFSLWRFLVSPGVHVFRNIGLNYRRVDFFQTGDYFIYRRELSDNFSLPVTIGFSWKRLQGQVLYNYRLARTRLGVRWFLLKRK